MMGREMGCVELQRCLFSAAVSLFIYERDFVCAPMHLGRHRPLHTGQLRGLQRAGCFSSALP